MNFDPAMIAEARREIKGAPHGCRVEKALLWASLLGLKSIQQVYSLINTQADKRTRKGTPLKPEYQDYARIVFQLKYSPPEDAGVGSTEDALAYAVKNSMLPETALAVPIATYNRIGRDNGWTKAEKRRNRIQAERPNEAHHFDGSSSSYFHIVKQLDDGDYLMAMHRPSSRGYKNKPLPADRKRPIYYGIADDHSGRLMTKVYAALGEDASGSMNACNEFWSEIGIPEELDMDQGMMKKCFASRDWVNRLGIKMPESMPYAKEAHGKIERPWRTVWKKFELAFYFNQDWKNFKITLSEFNRQLSNFVIDKYNEMPHRFEKQITKLQAWNRINLYGGVVKIPEGAKAAAFRRAERTIDITGKLEYNGESYEVLGLYNAKVWVLEGVYDDRLVVQDRATGIKYETRTFAPLKRNEFRAHKETPHEELMKDIPKESTSPVMLYADKKAANDKVLTMPIRTKEMREIEDPFDVDTYSSIQAAIREFMAYLPGVFLSPDERRDIEEAIIANGLSKQFTENLALEVRANLAKRVVM